MLIFDNDEKNTISYVAQSNAMRSISYGLIFVAGVVCALALLQIVKYYQEQSQIVSFRLPEAHYLQVRDDYHVVVQQQGRQGTQPTDDIDGPSAGELEALNSLKMALEMKLDGKEDKALRLFQHAIALAPKHAEVLNKYGEYLEHIRRDVVTADQMYLQVD